MRGKLAAICNVLLSLIVVLNISFGGLLLLITPEAAKAKGDPIFEVSSGSLITANRQTDKLLEVSAGMKVSEDGGLGPIGDETFAYFTLTIQAEKIRSSNNLDFWKINKISLSNLKNDSEYGATNSRINSEDNMELRNRSNELIAIVDYSKLPLDSNLKNKVPCLSVDTNSQRIVARYESGDNCETLGTATVQGGRITPTSGFSGYILAQPTKVNNYDLSGDPTDTAEDTKIKSWFKDGIPNEELEINISEEAGKAPFIDLRGDTQTSRPPLRFTLQHVGSQGAIAVKNVDWLIFKANRLNAAKGELEEEINNLYLIFDDSTGSTGGTNIIYSYKGNLVQDGKFDPNEIIQENFAIKDEHRKLLFGYIMNAPINNGDSCIIDEKDFKVVGVVTKGAEVNQFKESGNTNDPRAMDGNCLNTEASGWLAHWNVTSSSAPADQQKCGITSFLSGGIGVIVEKLVKCMLEEIIEPILEWAVKWVQYAAGVSYIINEDKIQIKRLTA